MFIKASQRLLSRILLLKYTAELSASPLQLQTGTLKYYVSIASNIQALLFIAEQYAQSLSALAGIKFVVTHRGFDSRGLLRGNFSIC